MMLLLFLAVGCGGEKSCEKMCLGHEDENALVVQGGGGTLDADAYRAMCATTGGFDCEECHAAIGAYLESQHGALPECGCGFSTEEVGECLFDEDITDEEAQEVVANCEMICETYWF